LILTRIFTFNLKVLAIELPGEPANYELWLFTNKGATRSLTAWRFYCKRRFSTNNRNT